MEELTNLTYKEEVEALKDEENFEALGDAKYLHHEYVEARLYWAFCRPSGSSPEQIADPEPVVSIMAFNHSRLPALQRFELLHPEVIADEQLRTKIRNRTRMLFRDLTDNDFAELNQVLALVPVFLPIAVDQLIHGRKWNDIPADPIEATHFLQLSEKYHDDLFWEAFWVKLENIEELEQREIKSFLERIGEQKAGIDKRILKYFYHQTLAWIEESGLHLLQKKGLQKLAQNLVGSKS